MQKEKEPVRIRFKDITNGRKSIYLDIYINGTRRYEFLKLYLLPETRANKKKNDETIALANAVRAKRIVEIQNGRFGFDGDNKTMLFPYIAKFIEAQKRKGVSYATIKLYDRLFFYLKRFGRRETLKMIEITPTWLNAFKTHLTGEKSIKTGAPLTKNTQAVYYSKLVAVINQAERDGLITKNPCPDNDRAQ